MKQGNSFPNSISGGDHVASHLSIHGGSTWPAAGSQHCVGGKSILVIKVMDLKNSPVRGVRLALKEPGCVELGPRDDRGYLRIKLAPVITPQAWVTNVGENSQ
jgi:hypothetical protein